MKRQCVQFAFLSGFTLIEILITLVVSGIVLAIAFPNYSEWILNQQIRGAADSVQNGLMLARVEAVRRNANVQFVLDTSSSGGAAWVVSVVTTGEVVQERNKGTVSPDAYVSAVTPAGATTATFTGLGRVSPTNNGGGVPFSQVDIDLPSAKLAASKTRELRVTLQPGGEVRMCDPKYSLPDPVGC